MTQKCSLHVISHACYIVGDGKIRLLTDPWFFGSVFNCGWKLEKEVDIQSMNINKITHVHITHEHPDHFHIPTLKKLNEDWDPVFLVQATSDRRIAKYISNSLGKRVIELKDGQLLKLSQSISIRSYPHGHMDSFSLINAANYNILNVNDCVLKTPNSLKNVLNRLKGAKIDILMTQYSFASYQGNEGDSYSLERASKQHLDWVRMRNDFFKPKVTIPFASGIVWSHNENRYLNKYSVQYSQVVDYLAKAKHKSIVLSPSPHSPITALENILICREGLLVAVNQISKDTQTDTPSSNSASVHCEFQTLLAAAHCARIRLFKYNHKSLLLCIWIFSCLGLLKDVIIQLNLHDNRRIFITLSKLLLIKEIQHSCNRKISPNISMSIDSFLFCLNNDFGAETLWVNSRFKVHKGNPKDFFKHFYALILSNQGFYFPFGYIKFIWQRIFLPRLFAF